MCWALTCGSRVPGLCRRGDPGDLSMAELSPQRSPAPGLWGTAALPARGHPALSLGTVLGAWCVSPAVPVPVLLLAVPLRVLGGSVCAGCRGTLPSPPAACRTLSRVGAALRGAAFCTGLVGKGGSESGGQGQQAGVQLSAGFAQAAQGPPHRPLYLAAFFHCPSLQHPRAAGRVLAAGSEGRKRRGADAVSVPA